MTFARNQRVVILQPNWNRGIWGYHGRITQLPGEYDNNPDSYTVEMDKPNPSGNRSHNVHCRDFELAPLTPGHTSHDNWSHA